MTPIRRTLASLAASLLLSLGVLLPVTAPTAQAASCSGVWVAVEGTVHCASSYGSGLTALRSAGFSVQLIGTGYICQIDGSPATCSTGVPYWSYWHAVRNSDGSYGSWQYSNKGATAYAPRQGDADGWSYGNGTPPTGRPPAGTTTSTTKPAPATSTTKAASSSTTTGQTATKQTATKQATAGGVATRAAASGVPGAAPGAATPGPDPTLTPGTSPAVSTPTLTSTGTPNVAGAPGSSPTPSAVPSPDAGTPTGTLVTLGALTLGGAGLGGWLLKRRAL